MLITLIEVIGCENPKCKEFARIASCSPGTRAYYCQTCGTISPARAVDAELAGTPERYKAYLRGVTKSADNFMQD